MVAGPATAAVPGPPTSVTAHAGDQLAEVTWTAPTPDDPTITGYVITAAPADTLPVTVDPTARTATVTGLTNGTVYTFTVAANNLDGTSPPRTPSSPITPRPPAATTLTLAASPTSILHGGTVQLSGHLQQTNTAEGIAGETLALERRSKGGASWTALATVTTASDGTLDPPGSHSPGPHRVPAAPRDHAVSCRQHQPDRSGAGWRTPDRPQQPHQHGLGSHRHHQRPGRPRPPWSAHPGATQAGSDLANHAIQDLPARSCHRGPGRADRPACCPLPFVRTSSTSLSRPALRAAACGGRPRAGSDAARTGVGLTQQVGRSRGLLDGPTTRTSVRPARARPAPASQGLRSLCSCST
jgi:hypothetical protein